MSLPGTELLFAAVALVVVAALLAGADAALTRVTKVRAADLVEEGRRGATALLAIATEPGPPLLVTTFLRVLAEMAAATCVALVMASLLPSWWQAALATIAISAAAIFVTVGVGLRTYGRQHADTVGLLAAPVIQMATRLLGPLARLLVLVGNAFTPGKGYRHGPFATEAELRELVDVAEESALIQAEEREMIQSVFELRDTRVREVMVPRTDLVSVATTTALPKAMTTFLRSGFSRMPVTGEDLDDVRGVLYLKDLARRMHETPEAMTRMLVGDLMREPNLVPDSKRADQLLKDMQRDAGHVAIVIDEYGGTAGMVTLEDLVEEIVGEISDEYDTTPDEVEQLGDERYRVSARLNIEDVGDLFDLEIEDEDVDTVGGLLAKGLGRVPIAGSSAEVSGLVLTAETFTGRRHRLDRVLVERAEPKEREQLEHQGKAS